MKNLYLIFAFFCLMSCSSALRTSYSNLSSPEKTWVTFHPFKAKKAFLISKEAQKVTDSVAKTKIIGNDNNGGRLDAFKHSFWMAKLTQGIGKRASYSLGEAHEKGNYNTFKERRLEDGFSPDKPSSDMDLFNNFVGIQVGKKFKKSSKSDIILKLLDSLKQGKLRILKKDSSGNFLDCENRRISLDSLKNRWNTKKCLVPSNEMSLRNKF